MRIPTLCSLLSLGVLPLAAAPQVVGPTPVSPRLGYAIEQLAKAGENATAPRVVVGRVMDPVIQDLVAKGSLKLPAAPLQSEGFHVATLPDGTIAVAGGGDSGVLYGCMSLVDTWKRTPSLAAGAAWTDAPEFVLRGPCIGMQKTYLLPGRKVYEYPYTPEEFPFFYDKSHWTEYLDYLVSLRMNTLYLWNGHPFASLVDVKEYPEAREVSAEVFERNREMFRWLTAECDRRGIWLVQQFYSILISKPLAEARGLPTQLDRWDPVAADYTRKAIAAFVRDFPHVGLMPCLGEALQEQKAQTRWLTEVILPGVKDGMAAAGLKEEPPVVLRTHATDATQVMPEALKVYSNLYTEAKFNGESLTTWEPRGVRQQLHLTMSRVGSSHIANVHILANLEPFRYGATRFIQKSVVAMRDRLGAKGVHLYPLFYWDWPVSPDITATPLKQWERDWIWFESWARYAWKADRDEAGETAYWVDRLAERFGTPAAGAKILEAYNDAGECAPRILRRFGITEGNRQTMALGMTLDQLVRPEKYREFPELWESQSPPGERLKEFAEKESKGLPHEGETPAQICDEVQFFSSRAVGAIEAAVPGVTRNQEEFARLRNDVHCIRAMSQFYATKAMATLEVLRYQHGRGLQHMRNAEVLLAQSVSYFQELTRLTEGTYKAANSMQTSQRRVPVPGGVGGKAANYHWTHLLPVYEKELADFRAQVAALENPAASGRSHAPLPPAKFRLLSPGLETFTVQLGNTPFADSDVVFRSVAPELEGLQGIKVSLADAKANRLPPLTISCAEPVRVLVGYFQARGPEWRRPPELETDATAGERGGVEALLTDAAEVDSLPSLNVHAFDFPAGTHEISPRGTGAFVVLGVVKP